MPKQPVDAKWFARAAIRKSGDGLILRLEKNRIVFKLQDGNIYALTVDVLEDAEEDYPGQREMESKMAEDLLREQSWYENLPLIPSGFEDEANQEADAKAITRLSSSLRDDDPVHE